MNEKSGDINNLAQSKNSWTQSNNINSEQKAWKPQARNLQEEKKQKRDLASNGGVAILEDKNISIDFENSLEKLKEEKPKHNPEMSSLINELESFKKDFSNKY